jgi:hypothetical protein
VKEGTGHKKNNGRGTGNGKGTGHGKEGLVFKSAKRGHGEKGTGQVRR